MPRLLGPAGSSRNIWKAATMLSTMQADERPSEPTKTIAQMSTLYQISLRTLRFYEDRGLMSPLRIGTQRLYASKDEVRLQIILKGKRLGFSLSEIEQLILSHIEEKSDAMPLDPDEVTTVALTPHMVRERIETLERRRDATNDAIAELSSHLQERVLAECV